jgi:transcription-repair coupling factor (superfamily II helicase)
VAQSAGRRETLRGLLRDNGFEPIDVPDWNAFYRGDMKLALVAAELERGLRLGKPDLAVVTEPQLYGERAAQKRRRVRSERDPEAIIRSLAELRIGDPVVHEDHGIGRYLGLQILNVGDGPTEFLVLEYAGGDKLYIPVLSLHLIGRYTGTDPEHAPLHKLGGDAWERAKDRARQKAHDAAAELLEVQALRAARSGYAFPPRDLRYQAFADAFPFEETPDQARAIEEVLSDLEKSKPTDRLVCGDVGFGKTEVAMRAAFLAVRGGKQVAVLVPTTLLVQQHFQNFRDRFVDVRGRAINNEKTPESLPNAIGPPVRIETLSRFLSKSQQAGVLAGLRDGSVDIVIGTHRLLQGDVQFADLGLVILDEEHRFGVRQKERLKRLRAEVDILTLTATPIPRTLNMALAGLRDVSIIATAPEGRLSVKTLVSQWDRGLIREACLREIRRGGQVYYLHNEVRTIDRTARQLQELIPEAGIHVAHGQLPERELERVMLDFYHRRFNILVCSTIIESGIDVPTANTIIIERADKFGLAQLHQLRGRVGRSHHRAYAYLLVPGRSAMTEDARKRLQAIEALEDLGSGFTLASHDLEIRGAGELLGEAQSGEIDEVGFALYSELLQRAVRSLQSGRTELGADEASGAEVNLHAPALFPADYLSDVHQRLILYKRIAGARGPDELLELQEEIVDRFGLLPDPAKLLFKATEIKIRAMALGIIKIDAGKKGIRIEFAANPAIDLSVVLRLLHNAPRTYKLDGPNRLRILTETPEVEQRIRALSELFDELEQRDGD